MTLKLVSKLRQRMTEESPLHARLWSRIVRWLIEAKFIGDLSQSKKDWIFTGTGPLQSFVAKIELAFALGLIKEDIRAELRLIGRIRNKFAHNFRRVRFSDPEITKLWDQLTAFDKNGMANEPDPMKFYGQSCFFCMTALFVTGQMVLLSHSPPPAVSAEKSE